MRCPEARGGVAWREPHRCNAESHPRLSPQSRPEADGRDLRRRGRGPVSPSTGRGHPTLTCSGVWRQRTRATTEIKKKMLTASCEFWVPRWEGKGDGGERSLVTWAFGRLETAGGVVDGPTAVTLTGGGGWACVRPRRDRQRHRVGGRRRASTSTGVRPPSTLKAVCRLRRRSRKELGSIVGRRRARSRKKDGREEGQSLQGTLSTVWEKKRTKKKSGCGRGDVGQKNRWEGRRGLDRQDEGQDDDPFFFSSLLSISSLLYLSLAPLKLASSNFSTFTHFCIPNRDDLS